MPYSVKRVGHFKTNQMAKKEKGRIEIVCNNDKEVTVTVEGERQDLIAALAGLISDDDENNEFHQLIHVAMTLALYKKQLDEEKLKKRAAAKKKRNAKSV